MGDRPIRSVTCSDPELLCRELKKSTQLAFSSRSTLEGNCQRVGLKFHGETPGNGNCFFEAVSSQLQRLNCAKQKSPQQLRQDVVSFMKANTVLYGSEGTINLAEFISNDNFNDYCERMARDGEWADHVVVVCMARMLQTDIMIVTSAPSSGPENIIAWVIGQTNFSGQPILLGHIWESHYQSLQPIDHEAHEVQQSNDWKKPVWEETATQTEQEAVDQIQSSVATEMPPSRPVPEDSEDDKQGRVIPVEIFRMDDKSLQLYKEALRDGKKKIYNIRVMVVGQFGVGKTTLTKRLLGKQVDISERKCTEGIDVYKHCCKISLDTGEWIEQHEDSDQLSRLQRLVKLLSGRDQKSDVSQEQEGHREVVYERETTPEADNTHMSDTASSSRSDQKDQLTYSQPAKLSAVKMDGGHGMAHSDQETSTVTFTKSEAESSKKEKKDAVIEILRLINENADKLEKDTVKYAALSIWDFAGQYAFYTTHQTFLSSHALYLLVIDLNQQITDLIEDDKCFLDMEGIKPCKVHDLVEIWMNSIHTCASSPEASIPHVILVGTHVDKLSEKYRKEVIDKYFKELRYILKDKPTIHHLMDDIAIDNTQSDPMLEILKRKIFELASQQPHWGEEQPARWLPLEQAIMRLKASGSKVVARSLIEEINVSGSIRIEDTNELDLFLRFHHEMGTILYFSVEGLRENIVLDPQWFIDALKSLITAEEFIMKYPAICSKWYEFKETGKLTHELIDAIWTEKNNQEFHDNKDHILLLMEKLNIIARPRLFTEDGKEVKEANYFLAPCMLQRKAPAEVICPKPNDQMRSSLVLCYVFNGNFMPTPIFHRLVAACVAHWPIATKIKKDKRENKIFCGCCVFKLDLFHHLTLHFRQHVIFVRVTRIGIRKTTPSSKLCIEAKEFITTNLQKIIGNLGQSLNFENFIQCPEYNGESDNALFPVSFLKENAEVYCDFHDNIIESCDLLKFWFKDQEQAGDGVAFSSLPLILQDKKPSELQLSRLSIKIEMESLPIGLELGLSLKDIQQIQKEYSHTVNQCLVILITWQQQNKDRATFRNLEKAFQLVGVDVDILKSIDTGEPGKNEESTGETSKDEDIASSLPHHMKDMKPSEGQLEELSKKIGQEIFLLGLELGLSLADILQIQKDHSQTPAECCHTILVKWQQQTEDRTSFKYLENAFQLVGIDVNILKSIGTGIPLEILRMDETSIRLFKDALQSGIERVYRIRVMVVGQFSVGKTALVKRLLGEEVNIKEKHSTEGIDVHVHCCDISLTTKEWIRRKEDAEQSYRVQRLVKLLKEHVQQQEASGKQKGQSIMVNLPANKEHVDMHHADIKISNQPVQSKTEVKTSNPLPSINHSPLPVVEVDKGHVEHLGQTKSSEGSPVIKAESRRSEEREDVSMEMLHWINKSSDKSKSMAEIAVLAMWDFAGQYIFYSTHQTFLTSRAVYLLVIDLEKPITEIIVDDQCFFDTQGIKECRVHNLTEIWLNSIHSCAPSPDADTPPVILVGTHVDKIPEANRQEVIDKYFEQILRILRGKPILKHVKQCISIDNTQFDPQLKNVKERIFDLASGQPYWGEEVPANWLPLEESLMKLKDSGLKVILLSQVEELNQKGSVPIKTTNLLDLFLRFQHEIGNIIYFSVEGLRERIVLDPQWLINALKSLITAKEFVLRYQPAVWDKWLEFSEKGILTTELIGAIWTADNHPDFYYNKEHILQLMEKLHIVARPRSSSEQYKVQYFIAPCMLKEATPKKLISLGPNTKQECTSALCFVSTGKFLQAPVFHKLLAACVAEWQIAEQNSSSLVFCGCCVFQLDSHHRLTLYFKDYVIFARIRRMGAPDECQSSLLCSKTRTFIFENLNQILGNLNLSLKFELHIQCPDSDADSLKGLIPLSTLENSPAVPCNSHDESHTLESKELLKFWFDVKQTNCLVEQKIPRISDLTLPAKHKLFLPPGKKCHAFFSYASQDIHWVKKTVERLENDHGFVCCEYDRDNTPGTSLMKFVEDSIRNACKTVIVMTEEAFKSSFVQHEIEMALLHGFGAGRKCVVPILLQDCKVPDCLRVLNYVDARKPNERDIWWPKLLAELQTLAGNDNAPEVIGSNQRNQHISEDTSTQLEQGDSKEDQQQLYITTESGTWV